MSGLWYCPACGASFKTAERLGIHVDLHYTGRRPGGRRSLFRMVQAWWRRAVR